MKTILREWEISDVDSIVKYANNDKIFAYMRDVFPNPFTEEKAIAFVENARRNQTAIMRAISFDNLAVGSIGVFLKDDIYRKNAEIAYWLAEDFWDNGIITESIIEIVDFVFRNYDIERVYALPFSNNFSSHKALYKSGFKLDAKITKSVYKNEEYLDEYLFVKTKEF